MKKLKSVDYLRALSMLYIVGYWHLFNYIDAFPGYSNTITYTITLVVLGLFVLISGFLIGRKTMKPTNSLNSIVGFYKKRLIKIYPLYFLAVLTFYIYGFNNVEISIKSLLLLSMYYGPAPLTLWFVTMLFSFYLVAPFLHSIVSDQTKFFLFVALIFLIAILLLVVFETVDSRLLFYFPCFCIGIYISEHGTETRIINIKTAFIFFFLGLAPFVIKSDIWMIFGEFKYITVVLSSSYLVFAISYKNEGKFKESKMISLLSYSSFSMYLFHRPIFGSMKSLFFPEDPVLQISYLYIVCLFMTILISWGLQKLYDQGLNAVLKK